MTIDEFCDRHPQLFHMAHVSALPQIERHGLLSTQSLVELFMKDREEGDRLCSERRPAMVPLRHAAHGIAYLRDQKPLIEKCLARSLEPGLTVRDWYRILNERAFLWADRSRLNKLLAARAYRSQQHLILTLDSRLVLTRHLAQITVTTINIGAAFMKAAPRGRNSLIPLGDYPSNGRSKPIVEVTVLGGLPEIRDYILSTELTRARTK